MTSPSTTPAKKNPLVEPSVQLRKAFLRSIAIPLATLVFFAIAPVWLNHRLHENITEKIGQSTRLSPQEKQQRIQAIGEIDFAQICRERPANLRQMHESMEREGICAHFQRLNWGKYLSGVLVSVLLLVTLAMLLLNRRARRSQADLIASFRMGWQVAIVAALLKLLLLIPLLAYGIYELTTLAADRYYPQLILVIVIGGGIALWRGAVILLKRVPLEFEEPLAREITPAQAPELWQVVRAAAARLLTSPPDHILAGMQLNFYVTELAVRHDSGRTEGRTLYLSLPLLKQLSPDEVRSIIGHELGHFIGEDTRVTREFYPLRFKADATMFALAQSGWVGWTSLQMLGFCNWSFGTTEQAMSREREFLADRKAAELTSASTSARSLVKFHVFNEAFQLSLAGAGGQRLENPFDVPLGNYVCEQLVPKTEFWNQLFEKKAPHPLDSHPTLRDRLEALGQHLDPAGAMLMATEEGDNAYACWFAGRDALFAELSGKAKEAVERIRTRVDAVKADSQTEEGRKLLEKYFPEQRWTVRAVSLWLTTVLLGMVSLGLLAGAVFCDDLALRLILGLGCGFMLACAVVQWKRHRHGELILRGESLAHSGWLRPLLFENVEAMTAVNNYGSVTVTFRLKTSAPGFWKYSLFTFKRKSVSLSLSWIDAKQDHVLQAIHRYRTRQIAE